MLFVTALPENLNEAAKKLEIEDEQRKLIDAVGALEATGDNHPKMVIEFLDVASLPEIKKALRQRQHDILHISGHGAYLADIQSGILYLENENGDLDEAEATELAMELRGFNHLKLLVLSACETAISGSGGLAETLASSGVPAVLAMRFSVTDYAAKTFTTEFYTKLANGRPISEAMSAGRNRLLIEVEEGRKEFEDLPAEWFTPVLYLNQYIAELTDPSRYCFPDSFYTHGQFIKEPHTRLIGAGFIGRKSLRIRMRQAFRSQLPVCLVGLGGMGKTTLAEAFARNFDNQSHRIIIMRGEQEITELGILQRIIREFQNWYPNSSIIGRLKGISEQKDMPIIDRWGYVLRNCLGEEKTILIFDNVEDLLWQEGDSGARTIVDDGVRLMIECLFANTPSNCRIIFTTRYKIEGLTGQMVTLYLDKLSVAEQYRLMNYSPALRMIDLEDREQIYKRLDGLPRAFTYLEALASNDSKFTWANLDTQLGLVSADVCADLMLAKIYGMLSNDLKQFFLVSSIFFTRTSIKAICFVHGVSVESARESFKQLQNWSLCYWGSEKNRDEEFEIHALTRDWVRKNQLLDAETQKQLASKAGEYFSKSNYFEDRLIALEYLELAQESLGFSELAQTIHSTYLGHVSANAAIRFGLEILKKSLLSQESRMEIYLSLSIAYANVGAPDTATEMAEKAKTIAIALNSRSGKVRAMNNEARMLLLSGKSLEAIPKFNDALQEAEGEDIGMILNNLGQSYLENREYETAITYYNQVVNGSFRPFLKSIAINDLGFIAKIKGEYKSAEALFKEALAIALESGVPIETVKVKTNLAQIYIQLGEFDNALELLDESVKSSQEHELVNEEGMAIATLGQLFFELGDIPKSNKLLKEAFSIFTEGFNKEGEASVSLLLGLNLARMEEFEEAISFLSIAIRYYYPGSGDEMALISEGLSFIEHRIGLPALKSLLAESSIKLNPE